MELKTEHLRWSCNVSELEKALSEVQQEIASVAQPRANRAVDLGLEITSDGFNIFVAGPEGIGKRTLVMQKVKEKAKEKPCPNDWCYVYNFANPQAPKAISLPAGIGKEFKEDMKNFIEHLKEELPKAFESKEYEEKAKNIIEKNKEEKEELLKQLNKMAELAGFALKFSPTGIIMIPIIGGQLVPEEKLLSDPSLREYVDKKRKEFEPILSDFMRKLKEIDKKTQNELKKLREDVALFVINSFIEDLLEKYTPYPQAKKHIEEVKEDIVKDIDLFLQIPASLENPFVMLQIEKSLSKYQVNVIVDNSETKHAPVIYETNPTYSNLFGRIALRAEFGVYVADFTQIVPGSIHKANGGFLILRLIDLLFNPGVWHALKRALLHKEIVIQPFLEELGIPHPISTIIRPQPIPLDIKVILLGDKLLFYLLGIVDPEFKRLFKIKAEFDETCENTLEMRAIFAATLKSVAEKEKLRIPSSDALARLLEYSSRLAEHQEKLHLKMEDILDVLREANFYAEKEKNNKIEKKHIDKALKEYKFRSNLIEEKIRELIKEGTIIVDLEGERVGQINGLSVIDLGDYSFGRPSRITATVFTGEKGIINIEREVDLAGKIFSKAVFILSGYIGGKYGRKQPLTLSASLAFEQSYSKIEGDSASVAELLALLSAISEIPLRQNIAVTGSIDQFGRVQPVGGINEKIEGFYKVCKITKNRGEVIIPKRNIKHLNLDEEVVEAVEKGEFKIHAVETIDEAIEIATGLKADKFHRKVLSKLKELHKYAMPKKEKEG